MKKKAVFGKNIQAIDIFCGIGGLSHGLQRAGIEILAGVDSDASCKYAYEVNNNAVFIQADVCDYPINTLKNRYDPTAIKILVGCAPCQTFSKHSHRNTVRHDDSRWNLLLEFARMVEEIKPDIVSMENVPGLQKHQVFHDFIATLTKLDYHISYKVIHCEKYGMPQMRRRLVLLASKYGHIEMLGETHNAKTGYITLRDAIGGLPAIGNGEICPKDKLHKASLLSNLNEKRIHQSFPGGTWHDWDKDLIPRCYKRKSGHTYTSVYGRLSWEKPATTITTQFYAYGTGRFGHPEQPRALSLREGALLQTFPIKYKFTKEGDAISIKNIGRHIGNAVPVRLGEIIGQTIYQHLKETT